ncbi:MAG: AAA family ATPase [Synergistaceae bacterium]|nr:AAA family ATPase [Synergistaceae bacterium]
MVKHIAELTIETFRGITEMNIKDLGDVNIFVGDNNSGKTSVLEAIQILSDPCAYNLILTARQRERYGTLIFSSGLNRLDSFMYLFNDYPAATKSARYSMRLGANIYNQNCDMTVTGSLAMQLINWDELLKDDELIGVSDKKYIAKETETLTFVGDLRLTSFDNRTEMLCINEYSPSILRHTENPIFSAQMINPMEHNSFRYIFNNKDAREQAVRLLKEFEPDIADLRYLENEMGRAVPIVETKHKSIPLSVYGDGMKKAMLMLNAIISAQSGVVLVDEFEAAIHTSAMGKVFAFILDAAKKKGVQLFLTTHSIEAVDKLLENSGSELERIRLIRLKNKDGKFYVKVTSGMEARELREQFEMEMRI